MKISDILPDDQTIVVEGQAYGEIPVDVTPEGTFKREGYCPFCGGILSEVRERNGVKYRHCYSCNFEFEVKHD